MNSLIDMIVPERRSSEDSPGESYRNSPTNYCFSMWKPMDNECTK